MSTLSTETLNNFAVAWERLYKSAVLSGIIGDVAHQERGGYHIGIQFQSSSNYSVVRSDDKAPPGSWPRDRASAVDMSMNLSDMKLCHSRLKTVWANRKTDPRAKFVNAWNGWDGTGSPGRYDMVTGNVEAASDDHEWHVHLEIRRRYVNDPKATAAILSILRGDSVSEFSSGDDDLVTSQAEFNTLMKNFLSGDDTRNILPTYLLTFDPGADKDGKVLPGGVVNYNQDAPANGGTNYTTTVAYALGRANLLGVMAYQERDRDNQVIAMLTQLVSDSAARAAADVARDNAMAAALQSLQSSGATLTDVQMQELMTTVGNAAAAASGAASSAANAKLTQLVNAITSAGSALETADDAPPPAAS